MPRVGWTCVTHDWAIPGDAPQKGGGNCLCDLWCVDLWCVICCPYEGTSTRRSAAPTSWMASPGSASISGVTKEIINNK